jgi:hypothetical protein
MTHQGLGHRLRSRGVHPLPFISHLRARGWLCAILVVGVLLVPSAYAGELEKQVDSLRQVPADAAFYGASLHLGDQWQAVMGSKAWAKLRALPIVKEGLKKVQEQLKSNPQCAQVLRLYEQPENQDLLRLLGDLLAQEVYFYGGEHATAFMDLMVQVGNGVRYGPLLMQLQLGEQGADDSSPKNPGQAQAVAALRILARNLDLLHMPDLVLGFKAGQVEKARAQLKRLTDLIERRSTQDPFLKEHVHIAREGQKATITLTLTGALVPWDQIPFKDFESKPGEFDALVKKLRELRLVVTLTTREQYVLLAVGESSAPLDRLGSGKHLAEAPEVQHLDRHAGHKVLGVSYLSQKFLSHLATTGEDLNSLAQVLSSLGKKANLTEAQQNKLRADLAQLTKELKQALPKVGAQSAVSLSTGKGIEGYQYSWTGAGKEAAAEPLKLLEHVGGTPLFAVVGHIGHLAEGYEFLARWLKIAHGHFEDIVLPKMNDDQKEKYEQVAKILFPVLRRFDQTTQSLLLPCLKGGEWALVLDAKLKSKQWHRLMPARDNELPMLEPALVLQVRDTEPLRKAFGEYRKTINDLIEKIREAHPEVPEFEIPEPNTKSPKIGTLYYYPIPEALGLDAQIMPNAGLSKTLAVATLSQKHTERLLGATPLNVEGNVKLDSTTPLLLAAYFDWAGLVTALAPWGEFAAEEIMERHGVAEGRASDPHSRAGILKQLRDGLQILSVIRHYASATYLEEGVVVTHSETVLQDVP